MKPAHTPTPWKVKETVKSFSTGAHSVEMGEIWLEDESMRIATGLLRKDAAFIVRAVNAHEEMLTALKACLSSLRCVGIDENNDTCGVTFTCHSCGVLRLAKQVIAKAEGE